MDTTDINDSLSQLGDCLNQAATSQRQLIQEMTSFAKDETSRFMNQRLERNSAALEKLQTAQGVAGILGVQQEWLRDLVQDYVGQQMRLASTLRGLTQNAMAEAGEAASDNFNRMQQDGREMAGQMNQAAQDAENYVQQTQH